MHDVVNNSSKQLVDTVQFRQTADVILVIVKFSISLNHLQTTVLSTCCIFDNSIVDRKKQLRFKSALLRITDLPMTGNSFDLPVFRSDTEADIGGNQIEVFQQESSPLSQMLRFMPGLFALTDCFCHRRLHFLQRKRTKKMFKNSCTQTRRRSIYCSWISAVFEDGQLNKLQSSTSTAPSLTTIHSLRHW